MAALQAMARPGPANMNEAGLIVAGRGGESLRVSRWRHRAQWAGLAMVTAGTVSGVVVVAVAPMFIPRTVGCVYTVLVGALPDPAVSRGPGPICNPPFSALNTPNMTSAPRPTAPNITLPERFTRGLLLAIRDDGAMRQKLALTFP